MLGTAKLAGALLRARLPRLGSMYQPSRLAAMLRDGDRVTVTFSTEAASRRNIELLSSRHPLVALALDEFSKDDITLRRFGYVGVPGLPRSRRYAVRLDLVHTTGLRPRRELWATAVDLVTGESIDDVETPLLTALAEGTLVNVAPRQESVPMDSLASLVSIKRRAVREERGRDNEAMVEGRIQSRRRGIALKIHRAEQTLTEVRQQRRDPRIIRLHEGRIRNLRDELTRVTAELEALKALTMSNDPVAILMVEGV
jgi:hypothetical protein